MLSPARCQRFLSPLLVLVALCLILRQTTHAVGEANVEPAAPVDISKCPSCLGPASFRLLPPHCAPHVENLSLETDHTSVEWYHCSVIVEQLASGSPPVEHLFVAELSGLSLQGEEVHAALGDQPRIEFVLSNNNSSSAADPNQAVLRYHFAFDLYDAGDYTLKMSLFLTGNLANRRYIEELSSAQLAPRVSCEQESALWEQLKLSDSPIEPEQRFHLDPWTSAPQTTLSAEHRDGTHSASSSSAAPSSMTSTTSTSTSSASASSASLPRCTSYASVLPGRWVNMRWVPLRCSLLPLPGDRESESESVPSPPLRYDRIFLVGTSETRRLFGQLCTRFAHRVVDLYKDTSRSSCGPFEFVTLCGGPELFVKAGCHSECSNLKHTVDVIHRSSKPLTERDLVVYHCGLHEYQISLSERRDQYRALRDIFFSSDVPSEWLLRTTNAVNPRLATGPSQCPDSNVHEREAVLRNNVRLAAHSAAMDEVIPTENLIDVYHLTAAIWSLSQDHVHYPYWVYDALAQVHLTVWSDLPALYGLYETEDDTPTPSSSKKAVSLMFFAL
eukprot:CAMPEP_0177677038 /NCGR_PEP_ID=MMETSP0447-20121125/28154_1 /TAXON_ID=0 /ORGANISM="Stygamoeba regulata, Strain BSH-02190019" /LENGTH=557 /DNA_ID=CAMNT_0019185731 /DNA_START=24 /DNA_END=1694 /DNA_ORIENTATION=+